MISSDTVGTVVGTIGSLLGLWYLLYWCVREYRVDYFRANVFALRAELFDLAADGELRFTDPAYSALRTTMNGFLRYGDRVGFLSLMIANHYATKDAGPESAVRQLDRQWNEALEGLSPAARAQLVAIRSRLHFEVFKQMVFGSPLLILTAIPVLVTLVVRLAGKQLVSSLAHRCYRAMESAFERFIGPLDATAYRFGS